MAPLTQLLLAAAWLARLPAAQPALPPRDGTTDHQTGNVLSSGKASLKQVRSDKYKFNGALSVYKTYVKHGISVPQYLRHAVARTGLVKHSNGTAIATPINEYDDGYTVPVSVGTPPQILRLLVDTGSSDTWGFSTLMPSSQVDGQTRYDPTKSSTAKLQNGSTWNVSYLDGSFASGLVYTDRVEVAGITVENQAFEAAKNVSDKWSQDLVIDGILGMGFRDINTVAPRAVKTFMDNAKASLDAPLFTADLKHKAPGTFNFGYIDPSSHEGDITYVPVYADSGIWSFSSSGFAVGSEPFVPLPEFGLADTGTTLFYTTRTPVHAYYARVPSAVNSTDYGGYVFPCNTTLPSYTFGIDKARITIPGKYLNAGSAAENETEPCFGGLQWSGDDGFSIFGDIALRAALVVFKYAADEHDLPMLGWANKTLD